MMTNKTALQTAIENAYQKKFDTNVIAFGGSGQFKEDVDTLTDEQIVVLFRYGKRKFNDMWNSSAEKKEGKTVQSFWSDWLETMVTGKTKGSRQSPTDKAWVDFCNSRGMQEGGHAINGKTLARAQRTMCRKALIAEHDPGTAERKDVENNMVQHLAERFDDWVVKEEEDNPILKMGIEYQTMLAQQKEMA